MKSCFQCCVFVRCIGLGLTQPRYALNWTTSLCYQVCKHALYTRRTILRIFMTVLPCNVHVLSTKCRCKNICIPGYLPSRSTPTRSTPTKSTPPNQLPLNQLGTRSTPTRSTQFFFTLSVVLHNTVRYIDT